MTLVEEEGSRGVVGRILWAWLATAWLMLRIHTYIGTCIDTTRTAVNGSVM